MISSYNILKLICANQEVLYDPEILEEAIAFQNTYKQANRIKCATLGWNGLVALMKESEE